MARSVSNVQEDELVLPPRSLDRVVVQQLPRHETIAIALDKRRPALSCAVLEGRQLGFYAAAVVVASVRWRRGFHGDGRRRQLGDDHGGRDSLFGCE